MIACGYTCDGGEDVGDEWSCTRIGRMKKLSRCSSPHHAVSPRLGEHDVEASPLRDIFSASRQSLSLRLRSHRWRSVGEKTPLPYA